MSFYARFASVYEQVFPLRPAVLDGVAALLGETPRRVLDIGCGPAHLGTALHERGHTAVGLDLDEVMIDEARRRDPRLDLHVLDMMELGGIPGSFGAALCLGNVLPHLEAEALPVFLRTLHGKLEPGAPWVVQTVNFDRLLGGDTARFPDLDTQEGLTFQRSYQGLQGTNCRFHTRLMRGPEELFRGDVGMTPFKREDLESTHLAAGFSCESIHADFTGTPYDDATSAGRVSVFRRDRVSADPRPRAIPD